jgi:hypothetical protein
MRAGRKDCFGSMEKRTIDSGDLPVCIYTYPATLFFVCLYITTVNSIMEDRNDHGTIFTLQLIIHDFLGSFRVCSVHYPSALPTIKKAILRNYLRRTAEFFQSSESPFFIFELNHFKKVSHNCHKIIAIFQLVCSQGTSDNVIRHNLIPGALATNIFQVRR